MTELTFHPLANIFPLIEGDRFDELVASVKANGLRNPIVLHDGQVLDGRNRYRACQVAGVDTRFEMFAGGDALAFVMDENLNRRHLNESQRAMVAARLANLPQGRPANLPVKDFVSQANAATKLNVSPRLLRSAKVVQERATPEVRQAVDGGHLAVSIAEKLVELPADEQRAVVVMPDPGKTARAEVARHSRNERLAEIVRKSGSAMPAFNIEKKYPIIYADPPWRFDVHSRETGLERTPDRHYPTMTFEEICALPVSRIVPVDEALLFLWITVPLLGRMNEIFRAWGAIECIDPEYGLVRKPWTYITHYVWDKETMGLGYWTRNQHETLLLAKIGNVPAPLPPERQRSVYREIAGDHSAKPKYFAELINKHYPDVPKIELFCRGMAADGFDSWGNQAIQEEAA